MLLASETETLPGGGPSQLTSTFEPIGHVTVHCCREEDSAKLESAKQEKTYPIETASWLSDAANGQSERVSASPCHRILIEVTGPKRAHDQPRAKRERTVTSSPWCAPAWRADSSPPS